MANGIDYLDFSQKDLLGSAAPNIPMASTIMPGYNEEMNIDDSGRITLRSYLKELGDTAKGGLSELAGQGMSLFDHSQRSNFNKIRFRCFIVWI